MLNRIANFQNSLNSVARKHKTMVAVMQLNSSANLQENYDYIARNVEEAAERGAKLICLPDKFAFQSYKHSFSELESTGTWLKMYK